MFEAHFGFTRTPFGRDLPPEQLFNFQDHLEAVTRFLWAITGRGLALLTGEVGSGKSTALRALHARLDPLRYKWLYISNPLLPDTTLQELRLLTSFHMDAASPSPKK